MKKNSKRNGRTGVGLMNLSERLLQDRAKHKLSQKEMSKLLNVSLNTYSLWERGKVNPIKISLINIEKLLKGEK